MQICASLHLIVVAETSIFLTKHFYETEMRDRLSAPSYLLFKDESSLSLPDATLDLGLYRSTHFYSMKRKFICYEGATFTFSSFPYPQALAKEYSRTKGVLYLLENWDKLPSRKTLPNKKDSIPVPSSLPPCTLDSLRWVLRILGELNTGRSS